MVCASRQVLTNPSLRNMVAAQRSLAHIQRARHVTDRPFLFNEQAQDHQPVFIGEDLH